MKILIIDDEEVLQDVLSTLLSREGFHTLSARSGREGLRLTLEEDVDLVLLDLMLPDTDGLKVLEQIRAEKPDQLVVVITAYSSMESAIQAMRAGAFDYIAKPFKNEEVLLTIERGLEQRRLSTENRTLKKQLKRESGLGGIVGKSAPMLEVYDLIKRAAPASSNILILGESGTGKELVAKAIHHQSRRAEGPFVVVNSGSMPPDLLESNLFGHEKGSFTGAVSRKQGLFEVADSGSLFLDEIGNIPLETQAKLLRVIQEKEFMRLGGVETLHSDARILAATNADLAGQVEIGGFREDLYYRLNVITIRVPPLRERRDDIPRLADYFLKRCAVENDKQVEGLAPATLDILSEYHWPGNVRELENAIERAVVLATGPAIEPDLLPAQVHGGGTGGSLPAADFSNGFSLRRATADFERHLIHQALDRANGVQKRAAELLQVKPTTLHEMMKRLEIPTSRER